MIRILKIIFKNHAAQNLIIVLNFFISRGGHRLELKFSPLVKFEKNPPNFFHSDTPKNDSGLSMSDRSPMTIENRSEEKEEDSWGSNPNNSSNNNKPSIPQFDISKISQNVSIKFMTRNKAKLGHNDQNSPKSDYDDRK